METLFDLVVIGGGPAGFSAALNAIARGGTCAVLSNPAEQNPLWNARRVDNYSGMRGASGEHVLTVMRREAQQAGAVLIYGRVTAVLPFGDMFSVTVNNDVVQGRRLLLAIGAAPTHSFPGEERYVGRGLSYCATCDGRLYRGKPVLVTGNAADLAEEAAFLQSVGCQVTMVVDKPVPDLNPDIPVRTAKEILLWEQDSRLMGLRADDALLPADGVFLLRQVTSPALLLAGLETDGAYVKVDRHMRTNIPGCYAAGDCTGQPLQIAKAVGEGLIAAQRAMRSISSEKQKG